MVQNPPSHAGNTGDVVRSLGQEDPLEKEMATRSSILDLEDPMDRGAWQATVHGVAKSQTRTCTYASSISLSLYHTHTHTHPNTHAHTDVSVFLFLPN